MNVLMLSWEFPPKVVGGLARHVHDLSVALAGQGVDVDVVTTADEGYREYENVNGVDVYRVRPHYVAARDFISDILQLNVAMLEKIMALLGQGKKYHLVHAHDWLVAFAARAVKHAERIPLIATIHATEFGRNGGLHNDMQRYISDVEWWLTYEAWNVICCSRSMQHELQRVFQLPADKISVIPNGVDPGQVNKGLSRPEGETNPGNKENTVFFVGRLVREKGVHVLLEAAPMVLSEVPGTKFVIAGKGPVMEELRSRAYSLGLENHVHFTGYIDDATRNRLLHSASVAVFPSLYEPFGIVALEAMAARVPVVASDTGGLSEIIEHGKDGLKCYPGNPKSLADQVIAVLKDRKLAAKLVESAYIKVHSRYSWQEIARQTMNAYQDVLNEHRQSSWTRDGFMDRELFRHSITGEDAVRH